MIGPSGFASHLNPTRSAPALQALSSSISRPFFGSTRLFVHPLTRLNLYGIVYLLLQGSMEGRTLDLLNMIVEGDQPASIIRLPITFLGFTACCVPSALSRQCC